MLLFFSESPSPEARFLVREKGKEALDWSLTFQMFALQGLPEPLTVKAPIDRLEISTQSLPLVKLRQRNTHEPVLNPPQGPLGSRETRKIEMTTRHFELTWACVKGAFGLNRVFEARI